MMLISNKKNTGKNKLSSTMLLLTLHAKHRKAIYPSSSLRDDKVGYEKNFRNSNYKWRYFAETNTGHSWNPTDTCIHFFLNNYVKYNPIQPVVPEGKGLWKETPKKLSFKFQFKYFSWNVQNGTSVLIQTTMKQSRKCWKSNYRSQ